MGATVDIYQKSGAQKTTYGTDITIKHATGNALSLLTSGAILQLGVGNPSPNNIRPIHGVAKDTVNGVDYPMPRELFGDDTSRDGFDKIAGAGTGKWYLKQFDDTEDWSFRSDISQYNCAKLNSYTAGEFIPISKFYCSHFVPNSSLTTSGVPAVISDAPADSIIRCVAHGPASGTVQSHGKQLFDKTKTTADKYINSAGILEPSSGWNASTFIRISPGSNYIFSHLTISTAAYVCFYDASQAFISGVSNTTVSTNSGKVVSPANTRFIRFSCYATHLNVLQLESGSTATPYEPYHGTSATIPTLASGDAYDVVSGTGKTAAGTDITGTPTPMLNPAGTFTVTAGSATVDVTTSSMLENSLDLIDASGYGFQFNLDKTAFPTLNSWKSFLAAQSVQVLYQLATPQTITGTPQTIALGWNNTITNDGGGQMAVTYTAAYERVAITSRAVDCHIVHELMRMYTLSFGIANTDSVRRYIAAGVMLECDGQAYDLTGYKKESGLTNVTTVSAEHVGYRLLNYSLAAGYAFVGTVAQIAADILDKSVDIHGNKANAEFHIGTTPDLGTISFSLNNTDAVTAKYAIMALKKSGAESDCDNFTINFADEISSGNSETFRYGVNMDNVSITYDASNGTTYEISIADLQQIPGHSGDVFDVGDTVTVIDSTTGEEFTKRIINYGRCIDDPTQNKIALGVFVSDVSTQTAQMSIDIDHSIKQAEQYSNVSIDHQNGFMAISSDGTQKVFMNATNGYVIKQLYNGSWVTIWQADSTTGKTISYNLAHTQKVEQGGDYGFTTWVSSDGGATWEQTSGLDSSGGLSVQKGTFSGLLNAVNGTFGTITAGLLQSSDTSTFVDLNNHLVGVQYGDYRVCLRGSNGALLVQHKNSLGTWDEIGSFFGFLSGSTPTSEVDVDSYQVGAYGNSMGTLGHDSNGNIEIHVKKNLDILRTYENADHDIFIADDTGVYLISPNGPHTLWVNSTGVHCSNGSTKDVYIPSGDGHAAKTIHFTSGIMTGQD